MLYVMGENVLDNLIMDLDLNQEPPDPPPDPILGFRSFLNTLESAHTQIEERIRHLESVTARAWERHRRRRTQNFLDSNTFNGAEGMSSGSGRGYKRDSSHLVAKALAMDSQEAKPGVTFFDCNICLSTAREPVLTCCGHLYCWSCFFQLPYVDSMVKECPVCKGDVADGNITPIYCNGGGAKPDSGLKIPPRPKAQRVESVRQQQLSRGLSHVPVAEALRRIRASIGMPDPSVNENAVTSSSQPRELSRVLSESAASLSSELDNATRIFEGLVASISDRLLGSDRAQDSPATPAYVPSSSHENGGSGAVEQLANLMPSTNGERDQVLTRSSSSSGSRFSLFRYPDINNGGSARGTRRRLN